MESPALSDKPLPFSRMQGTHGCGHIGEKYADAIMKLQEEFDRRFADFKTHRATFQIFADPFSFEVQDAPPVLRMELIDLQCNSELKAKFKGVNGNADKLGHFLRELPPTFPELSRMFDFDLILILMTTQPGWWNLFSVQLFGTGSSITLNKQ